MNRVDFLGHSVSKLIIGDNPMTGHSYIEDQVSGIQMKKYYTAETIKKTLFRMEELGYNTMLPLADPYMIRVLQEYKNAGGKMQFIFQPFMPMDQMVSMRQMMELEPMGIYHQGTTTDYLYENGRCDEILSMIQRYHTMGIPVGLGTHLPEVIERSEKEKWPVDFYMACMMNARKSRKGEQSGFLTGKSKRHLIFTPEIDMPIMLDCLKKVTKPIIAFKIFAGGQMFIGLNSQEKKARILQVYQTVFFVAEAK